MVLGKQSKNIKKELCREVSNYGLQGYQAVARELCGTSPCGGSQVSDSKLETPKMELSEGSREQYLPKQTDKKRNKSRKTKKRAGRQLGAVFTGEMEEGKLSQSEEVGNPVAGFSDDDIDIQLTGETLEICGTKPDNASDGLVHHGLAYRSFNRKFVLAEDRVVKGAAMSNGLLYIALERIVPEHKKPRKIALVPMKKLLT